LEETNRSPHQRESFVSRSATDPQQVCRLL